MAMPVPCAAGHCGLVKVSDEDLVRPLAQSPTKAPDQRQPHSPASSREPRRALHPPAEEEQQPGGTLQPPASRSAHGSSAGVAQQTAEQLAEAGEELLGQGRAQHAARLLQAALQRCPLGQVELARRVIDLLLDAEQDLQATPSSGSRSATEQTEHSPLGGEASGGSWAGLAAEAEGGSRSGTPASSLGTASGAQRELRYALEALSNSEPRRALQHLQAAEAGCPPHLSRLRRRVALWKLLLETKRHL